MLGGAWEQVSGWKSGHNTIDPISALLQPRRTKNHYAVVNLLQ